MQLEHFSFSTKVKVGDFLESKQVECESQHFVSCKWLYAFNLWLSIYVFICLFTFLDSLSKAIFWGLFFFFFLLVYHHISNSSNTRRKRPFNYILVFKYFITYSVHCCSKLYGLLPRFCFFEVIPPLCTLQISSLVTLINLCHNICFAISSFLLSMIIASVLGIFC